MFLIIFSRNAEDSGEHPRLAQTDNLRLPQQHQLWFAAMNGGRVTSGWNLLCMLILDVSQQALREICCEARTQPPNAIIIPWHSNWHGPNILQAHWAFLYMTHGEILAEQSSLAAVLIITLVSLKNLQSLTPCFSQIFSDKHAVAVFYCEAAGHCYCSTWQLMRYGRYGVKRWVCYWGKLNWLNQYMYFLIFPCVLYICICILSFVIFLGVFLCFFHLPQDYGCKLVFLLMNVYI